MLFNSTYWLQWACDKLAEASAEVSLFMDPDEVQIDSAIKPEIVELNIGHSIIAQALFSGLAQTVKDRKRIMRTNSRRF